MPTSTPQATLRPERTARLTAPAPAAAPVARTAHPLSRPLDQPSAVSAATADRSAAESDQLMRRYLVSAALRLGSLVAAALLPLPLLARLALLIGCMVLSFGATMGGDAESARRRRQQVAARASAEQRGVEAPATGDRIPQREGLGYRLRWRTSYALLTAYGPAQLNGSADPREQMRAERADRRAAAVTRDR